MKIQTVQHAVPSMRVTNDLIVELIREQNRTTMDAATLDLVERKVRQFLRIAGTQERFFIDPSAGEKSIDLVLDAGRRALKDAAIAPEDIDFLIYTGVGRGWLEPAMANVVQAELGLSNGTVFDVMDACASWLKALQIGHSFVRNGSYGTGMIVNCESSFVNFADFKLNGIQDLEHKFAAFTVGEAATATIVTDENPEDDFYFKFRSFGEHYGLCMIPLQNMQDFMADQADSRYTPGKFFSLSTELVSTTLGLLFDTFAADPQLSGGTYDMSFGHAASEKASDLVRRRLGVPKENYYATHPRFGNTVSASVPLGMSLALEEGKLNRGDRTLVVIGSAGISVGFASFTY